MSQTTTKKTELPASRIVWHYKSANLKGLPDKFKTIPWGVTCFFTKKVEQACHDIAHLTQYNILR